MTISDSIDFLVEGATHQIPSLYADARGKVRRPHHRDGKRLTIDYTTIGIKDGSAEGNGRQPADSRVDCVFAPTRRFAEHLRLVLSCRCRHASIRARPQGKPPCGSSTTGSTTSGLHLWGARRPISNLTACGSSWPGSAPLTRTCPS